MNEAMQEKIREIKQSFRLMMNGTASRSMREKGADYKLNWGVSLPDLQKMADEIGKDYDLAIALWKEDVRECKILATMVMPTEKMLLITIERSINIDSDNWKIIVHCITLVYNFEDKLPLLVFFFFQYLFG